MSATPANAGTRVPIHQTDTGTEVYVTPRMSAPSDHAIKLRVIRTASGVTIHVTAPDPESAETLIAKLFGPDQLFLVELCG